MFWRIIILIYSTLLCLDSLAQKRIVGEVFEKSQKEAYDEIKRIKNIKQKITTPINKYTVRLNNKNLSTSKGKLIYTGANSKFDFTLTPKQLKQYKFLEFKSCEASKLIAISNITHDSLKVILDSRITLDTLKVILESRPQLIDPAVVKKPAIYLYPKKETDVAVTLDFKGTLLTTYPEYINGWNVIATQGGKLFNKFDRRSYNYLFWDGSYSFPKEHYNFTEGFYVPKIEYVNFLITNLTQLGLNETEINDFIVYWLPQMNMFKYCFIHFNVNDNIYQTAFIHTNPPYDSQIRIFMEFQGFNNAITEAKPLMPQQLPKLQRFGFSLIEWGGSEVIMNF